MHQYNATIDKVIDGDTVDITIDLGFSIYSKQRVRIEGINAPEKNTAEGMKAADYLRLLLPAGTKVIVNSKKPGAGDKYGRYLADITITNLGIVAGTTISQAMIASGHAFAWDGKGVKPV